ncbi:MAG: acyl-CoA dehydrogenase family protein [Pseudolabrys sp.]
MAHEPLNAVSFDTLRAEVRAFLAEEGAAGTFDPYRPGHGDSHNRDFSQRVGAKGWIGITWPKQYGGRQRSFLERYVVPEEYGRFDPSTLRCSVERRASKGDGHCARAVNRSSFEARVLAHARASG